MYIGEKYKVGVIYNKDNLTLVRIICKVSATDENIYKTLKSLAPLIDCAEPITKYKPSLDTSLMKHHQARSQQAKKPQRMLKSLSLKGNLS